MRKNLGVAGTLALAGMIFGAAWQALAAAEAQGFTPPGENIALGKPIALTPAPDYQLCRDPGDLKQLTDGVYTQDYFWTQKSTVGWNGHKPVIITIDLGKVEPIRGISFNTAAGAAGVTWPAAIPIVVSDDENKFYVAGELTALDAAHGRPPATGYGVHRYWTDALRTHGRTVSLVICNNPYTFADEVEVYRGEAAWLGQPLTGEAFASPRKAYQTSIVGQYIRRRLGDDARAIGERLKASGLRGAAKDKIGAELAAAEAGIAGLPLTPMNGDFRAVLPLNALHRRIFRAQAALWRAEGAPALTVWRGGPWDPLEAVHALPREKMPPLELTLMRNEYRAAAINLSAAGDEPLTLTLTLKITGLPGGANPPWLAVHVVAWTDTEGGRPVAAALPEARHAGEGYQVGVEAGLTRQVWLTAHPPKDLAPGTYHARLALAGPGVAAEAPLTLRVSAVRFPDRPTLHLGGWDYADQDHRHGVNARNRDAFIGHLREHFVDSPWASADVMGFGPFDAAGKMTAPPHTAAFDEWLRRWSGARQYCVFLSVAEGTLPFPADSPAFRTAVGEWLRFWADHARRRGLQPEQLALHAVDEPHDAEADARILAWAQAIHAARTGVRVWVDPTHENPFTANQAMLAACDVLCPNRPMFLQNPKVHDYYANHRPRGPKLAFYSCSGPVRTLDPYAYHRLQAWACWQYGAREEHFWSFGDSGEGSSWNEYGAGHTEYTPLFLDSTSVTAGKQMEAIREGVEDYEYFVMLRAAVAAAEKAGRGGAALERAKALLADGARRVCAAPQANELDWAKAKDRGLADRVRLDILATLEALGAK